MNSYLNKLKTYCKKHWLCITFLVLIIGITIFYRRTQFCYWLTVNTGSVADWIGNVSIPAVLAWGSHQYTVQKKRQNHEDRAAQQFKMLLDLLVLINSELPQELNQSGHNEEFKEALKNNLDLISKTRDVIYAYRGLNDSEPIYQELKRIIAVAQSNKPISNDQAKKIKQTLVLAVKDLQDEYSKFNDNN